MEDINVLTKKTLRYAMIKGVAEKRNPKLKPLLFQSLVDNGLLNIYIESVLAEINEDTSYYEFN